MKNLVWFRNDLRVHDNPALSSACSADNEVVAVYIVSEPQWKEPVSYTHLTLPTKA